MGIPRLPTQNIQWTPQGREPFFVSSIEEKSMWGYRTAPYFESIQQFTGGFIKQKERFSLGTRMQCSISIPRTKTVEAPRRPPFDEEFEKMKIMHKEEILPDS